MCQCEKTVNQAEQNKSHAVAGIEAHPTPPHCCFFRHHRCNLAHTDLQCGVTGPEVWPPECIDQVDDSEREVNARTENHENLCGQDALLMLRVQRLGYAARPRPKAARLETCVRTRIGDPFQLCNDFSTCWRRPHSKFYGRIVHVKALAGTESAPVGLLSMALPLESTILRLRCRTCSWR